MNIASILKKPHLHTIVVDYLQIVLGCLVGGLAYPLFLVPNSIAPGGLTGVATVLNYLYQWPVGVTSLLMNIPLFLVGYKAMGRVFVIRSFIATVLFSLAIDLLQLPTATEDPMLSAVFGGVLLGIGLGLILRGGATTGGSDMVARLIHHRLPVISVGMFLFIIDCCVILLAAVFIGGTQALYGMVSIYVSGTVVDVVLAGLSANKACFIMTEKWDAISQKILADMDRGCTHLSARGGFSGSERPVVLCVISRQEVSRLKQIVIEEDETAFMFITDAHEALGEGFNKLTAGS